MQWDLCLAVKSEDIATLCRLAIPTLGCGVSQVRSEAAPVNLDTQLSHPMRVLVVDENSLDDKSIRFLLQLRNKRRTRSFPIVAVVEPDLYPKLKRKLRALGVALYKRTEVTTANISHALEHAYHMLSPQVHLAQQAVYHRLLSTLISDFNNADPHTFSTVLYRSMGRVGRYLGIERLFVSLGAPGSNVLGVYADWHDPEWCIERSADPDLYRAVNLGSFPHQQYLRGASVAISSIQELPPTAIEFARYMKQRSIQSMLLVPLIDKTKCIGTLTAWCTSRENVWSVDEMQLLKLLSGLFLSGYRQQQSAFAFGELELRHRALLEGFHAAVAVCDASGIVVECNQKLAELAGDSMNQLVGSPLPAQFYNDGSTGRVDQQGYSIAQPSTTGGRLDLTVEVRGLETSGEYSLGSLMVIQPRKTCSSCGEILLTATSRALRSLGYVLVLWA